MMRHRSWLMPAISLAMGILLTNPGFAAAPHSSAATVAFQRGIVAFGSGRYAEALRDFRLARRNGMSDVHLTYNLGATYYHLGEYAAARREFLSLAKHPDLAALSHYNLGLIALKQGNRSEARRDFQHAHAETRSPALAQLASTQLARLGTRTQRRSTWVGFANAAAGYDSNVTFTSQNSLLAPAQKGSAVLSLLAGGVGQVTGTYRQGLQIIGSFYRVDYPSVSQFSQTYLRVGGKYKFGGDNWANAFGVYGGHINLGGSSFETLGTVKVESRHTFSPGNEMRGSYSYTRVMGGSIYGYLSGWQQAFDIEDTAHWAPLELTLGYSLDLNQRNNLSTPTQFFSVSPTRNGVFGRVKWHYSDAIAFFVEGTYQHSRYDQPNVLVQGGTTTRLTRVDSWRTLELGATYALSNVWNARADYRYTRNTSNIPFYSFNSNRVMFSLEYLFL